jgi:hypothetical protein
MAGFFQNLIGNISGDNKQENIEAAYNIQQQLNAGVLANQIKQKELDAQNKKYFIIFGTIVVIIVGIIIIKKFT